MNDLKQETINFVEISVFNISSYNLSCEFLKDKYVYILHTIGTLGTIKDNWYLEINKNESCPCRIKVSVLMRSDGLEHKSDL